MHTACLQITRVLPRIIVLGLAGVALILDIDLFLFNNVLTRIRATFQV